MQLPSLTVVASVIFIAYIAHSVWTIGSLYFPPKCTEKKNCVLPYLKTQHSLQMLLFVTPSERFSYADTVLVDQFDIKLDITLTKTINIPLPYKTRRNGTLFFHAFLAKKSQQWNSDEWTQALQDPTTSYAATAISVYQTPVQESFNLIRDKEHLEKEKKEKPVTHIYSKLVLNILDHKESLPKKEIPPDIAQVLSYSPKGEYLPVVYIDLLGCRLADLVPVNQSVKDFPVELVYSPISFGKLRLWMQFSAAMHTLRQMGFTEKDIDELKGIFADTNIVLLCVTFIVAALHMLFDFLAFKNDIYFWRDRENMVGLSSRTLLWRAFSQFIIFLYLVDENTSLLVVIPAAIGTLIEVWKVTKAYRITLEWINGVPRLNFGQSANQEEAETEQYDSMSMKYLSYVLYPLCVAGAIYSLIYTSHRSWYSWGLQSMVNGVYAFGFLFMLPQLFVNYKLKSVAHLPWRAFMYKAFNTFIDDIFAFIITMPTAHRVACFRDDAVFLIYLYQRWLYPVDKKRMNEFGATGEEHQQITEEDKKDK
ncbi:lipid scramblase CLPTM1L-like [Daphnia carinata]|uniref:lipid scramblase CLPTM1L-like n=1 Tax=Daphnia carinata TaxID=120202 RepID=UPI00257C14C0|nr:lipid scramblase CLPTM1L-like [Daphnia carinata]